MPAEPHETSRRINGKRNGLRNHTNGEISDRAAVALYQYTPYRAHYWGGSKDKPHMTAGNGVLIWIWRNDLKLVAFEGATSMDGPDMELTHDYGTGQLPHAIQCDNRSDGRGRLQPDSAPAACLRVYG